MHYVLGRFPQTCTKTEWWKQATEQLALEFPEPEQPWTSLKKKQSVFGQLNWIWKDNIWEQAAIKLQIFIFFSGDVWRICGTRYTNLNTQLLKIKSLTNKITMFGNIDIVTAGKEQ